MLKLKEIELVGFKSFADRARMICDGSTAAVVGPNGCGKSNLADAISWVLGEQSARVLRGERMSDVIFNGTGTRPATGMAEVSMTLAETEEEPTGTEQPEKIAAASEEGDSAKQPASPEAGVSSSGTPARASKSRARDGEIKVTRRLFRSGESEYRLNGSLCRLRDIQDIFMGTGLGPESYAIIEQGRIEQILSSKPSDRRAIIEEAAGVSKFKSRKRLAEAKLESSRQNLARINDILEEISKQVNSLRRQASKAARYRELQQEMRARQRRVFTSRLLTLEAECARLRQVFAAIREESCNASRALEMLEGERNSAAERHERAEEELKRVRETLAKSELESERLRSRLEKSRQQAAVLEMRRAEAQEERGRLEQQAGALDQESQEQTQRAEQVRAEWAAAQAGVIELLAQQAELAGQLAAAETEMEAQRREMLSAISRAADLRNQLVKTDEMGLSVGRQLARSEAEQAGAEEERLRAAAELEAIHAEHLRNETAMAVLVQSVSVASAALEEARQSEAARREEVESLSRHFSQVSARKQALEESLARHAYSTDSVRRLLSTAVQDSNFQPLGVLADFLEVAPGYEEVVEEFLKSMLDSVVVERHEEARSGIAWLESEGRGRSSFFVRSFASNGHTHDLGRREVDEARQEAGVVASLQELVRFESRLGLNGDVAFPVLANSFVVEDAAVAERLAVAHPSCHFLTRKGEYYHHRVVAGGKVSSPGPLAQRRDFRDLERQTSELEAALNNAEAHWAEAKGRLHGADEELRRLTADQLSAEKQSVLASEKLRQSRQAVRRAEERISVLQRESMALGEERKNIEQRSHTLQAELGAARHEQERREQQMLAATGSARQLRASLDQVTHTLTGAQVKTSALEERWKAADAERDRVTAAAAEARARLAHLGRQSQAWNEETRQMELEAQQLETALGEAEGRQQELRGQAGARVEESQTLHARRDELNLEVETARAQLETRREKRSEAEVALARAESDLNHHAHQCREELNAEPEALRTEVAPEGFLEGEPLRAAEDQLRELKVRLERLGPVNMMALEELQDAETRLNFLDTQRQDLLSSINDTTQTIREIDDVSRRKFIEAFRAINGFFAESFRTLFGGGVGEMRFSDDADAEGGIDLVAQPPGKRLQNVLLLSGGEKALTALALLIAVFRFTPSPFCILDEVDAPLDESNITRFTRMIEQMSDQTQFILITHNKKTMEACRILYGVTMEEAGVSRLVSVRFEAREAGPMAVSA